jgi:hypothetical protein
VSEHIESESAEDFRKRQNEAFRKAATESPTELLRASSAAYFRARGKGLPPWKQPLLEDQ